MLAFLNCHTYIVFVVVFTFVDGLWPGRNLPYLSVAGCWLLLATLLLLLIQQPAMGVYQGRRRRGLTIRSVYWQRQTIASGIICMCISCIWGMRMLYLQFCAQVYHQYHYCWSMVKQFNISKMIPNVLQLIWQAMMYVSVNYICKVTIIHFVQKIGKHSH